MLLEHARIGDIVFDRADKSIWGIRHVTGIDSLVRVRSSHDGWNLVIEFPYGRALFDLDMSPDGTLLSATVSEINGDSHIDVYRVADLLAGKVSAVATLSLGQSTPEGGAFSADGKYIYATAYYTGVSNVYRLNIATNTFDAVSNIDTGFFRRSRCPMDSDCLSTPERIPSGQIKPKPLSDLGNVNFELKSPTNIDRQDWAVGSPARCRSTP
jgi:hypothetical protein